MGLRSEDSIAELCRREGIAQRLYYNWSKEFLEAGKKRLAGDTAREASSGEDASCQEPRLTSSTPVKVPRGHAHSATPHE